MKLKEEEEEDYSSSSRSFVIPWQVQWKQPQWMNHQTYSPASTTTAAANVTASSTTNAVSSSTIKNNNNNNNNNRRGSISSSTTSSSTTAAVAAAGGGGDEDEATTTTLITVGVTTARIDFYELPELIRNKVLLLQKQQQQQQQNKDNIDNVVILLSVTLLSPSSSSSSSSNNEKNDSNIHTTNITNVASELLLELFLVPSSSSSSSNNTNNNNHLLLSSCRLNWPESIFRFTNDINDDEKKKKNNKNKKKKKDNQNDNDDDRNSHNNNNNNKDNEDRKEEGEDYDYDDNSNKENQEEEDNDDNNSTKSSSFLLTLQEWFTLSPLLKTLEKIKSKRDDKEGGGGAGGGTSSSSSSLSNNNNNNNGVISATLLRRQVDNSSFLKADALDTISLMSLGIMNTMAGPNNDNNNNNIVVNNNNKSTLAATEGTNDDDDDQSSSINDSIPDELYLACLTANGMVAIYSPWKLLGFLDNDDGEDGKWKSTKDPSSSSSSSLLKTNQDDFVDSMAKIFFGQEIFSKLEEVWLPLSQPLTTISLSILEQNHIYRRQDQQQQQRQRQQQKAFQQNNHNSSSHNNSNNNNNRALDVSLWNHLVESATIPHRTVANQATNLAMAGQSYLVVLGSGIPYTQVYDDDDDSYTTADRQYSQRNIDKEDWWDHESNKIMKDGGGDDFSSKGKFNNNKMNNNKYVTDIWYQKNDGTDGILEDDGSQEIDSWQQQHDKSNGSAKIHRINIDDESDDNEDEQFPKLANGGFVTFCSTAQWSETRTLFLPFSPKQVSYIPEWNSMELLLVLGETQAMAIRMDASPFPVELGATAVEQQQMPSSAVIDGRHSPAPNINDNFIWINRFQVLPIPFPQTSVRGRLLCGSAMGVQPPALLQLYTEESRHGLVLQKTLKGVTSLGTIEVSHSPSQMAKIQVQEGESLENAWSLLGQVRIKDWIFFLGQQ